MGFRRCDTILYVACIFFQFLFPYFLSIYLFPLSSCTLLYNPCKHVFSLTNPLLDNTLLLPKMRARQIVHNPAWASELNGDALQTLSAANRHCILAIAVGYRIMCVSIIHSLDLEPSTSGPASHLWQEFYRHIGNSIRALNDDIRRSYPGNVFNIFSSMAHLMSAEVRPMMVPSLQCSICTWR